MLPDGSRARRECAPGRTLFIGKGALSWKKKESPSSVSLYGTPLLPVNSLLHEFGDCIIGRMGVPYREKSINIISIIVCAPSGRISALSGRLGRIKGITARAMQVS